MKVNLEELTDRNKFVFNQIIESYITSGTPVGSKTLSENNSFSISPATYRNVMSELEEIGLLYSPHISSGRLPTSYGLKLYINSIMQFSEEISESEKETINNIESLLQIKTTDLLQTVSSSLSGLSMQTGIVVEKKFIGEIKHIEFVKISSDKALVVLVDSKGSVENRIISNVKGIPSGSFEQASNYLNSKIKGKNLDQIRNLINTEISIEKLEIDLLATNLINQGLAVWSDDEIDPSLIICGQEKLLDNIDAVDDIKKIKNLFLKLEKKEFSHKLLEEVKSASGIKIFIGAENNLFANTGCSIILAPYGDASKKIIGAIGVIGPTRMNYSKIIPIVTYTSKMVTKFLSN